MDIVDDHGLVTEPTEGQMTLVVDTNLSHVLPCMLSINGQEMYRQLQDLYDGVDDNGMGEHSILHLELLNQLHLGHLMVYRHVLALEYLHSHNTEIL